MSDVKKNNPHPHNDTNDEPGQEIILFQPFTKIRQYRYRLFLGGLAAANDPMFLRDHHIRCIMTVDLQMPPMPPMSHVDPYRRVLVHISDVGTPDLQPHFPAALDWIHESLSHHGNTLVHCQSGIKRAPTIVAAFLLQDIMAPPLRLLGEDDVSFAVARIQEARPSVRIPAGFLKQLLLVPPAHQQPLSGGRIGFAMLLIIFMVLLCGWIRCVLSDNFTLWTYTRRFF